MTSQTMTNPEFELKTEPGMAGLIKSDSPTPRATDFWGRASEKLPPARPRTSDFYGQSSHLGIFVKTGCSSRRQYVTAVRLDIFRSMWHM